ncbi:M1 family aminopeptidase [Verrucomicrobia bacterium]|nr:M1 family aminopeptidase [Verrucomicrobiota bacterium]
MKCLLFARLVIRWMGMAPIILSCLLINAEQSASKAIYCSKHSHFLAPTDSPDHHKYAPSRWVDILHLKLDITPHFQKRSVSGTTTLTFKPIAPSIEQLKLNAVDLELKEVTSTHALASWHVSENMVVIDFAAPIPADLEVELSLKHAAQPSKGMYFRTPEMGYKEGETHLFTQGEPHEARHWFPSFDAPNEKFTSEITCHVPEGMVVLSNGRLTSRTSDSDAHLTTFTWLQDKPHVNYLISVVAGYFQKIEDTYKDIPMAFWTLPSEIQQAQHSFKDTKAMMGFFEEEIGIPYPWAKYDQVCVNDFVAGGMENTSLTSLTDATLFTSETENLKSSQGLVAHELAHQWFGDLVTCKDWSHLWLNEGFATYYDALFEEHKHGRDAFLYQMFRNAKGFAARHSDQTPIVDRAYNKAMDQFGYRAYPKGSWILHMLRSQLGSDLYRKCIKTYLNRHAYGVVVTENLNAVLEELSGRSFDRFFDQYVYHGGHPSLSLKYHWDSKLRMAKISVNQQQSISDKVMLFELPATIRFKTSGETIDHPVIIRNVSEDFYISLPEEPRIVRFDPEFTLLANVKFSKPTPMILAQLEDASDVIGRIRAIEGLAKNTSSKSINALKRCLEQDPFYGVRMEAADALKRIHSPEALQALLDSRAQEDARVRHRVQMGIGAFFSQEAMEAALKTTREESNPTIANTAVRALGNFGSEEAMPVLSAFLRKTSYRNTHAETAIAAMESIDNDSFVMPILNSLMQRKPSFTTRGYSNALSSLAHLSRHAKDKSMVMSFIAGNLHDPKERIRIGAMRALGRLRDTRAIPMLRHWMHADPDSPEHKAAKASIDTLQKLILPGENLKTYWRDKVQAVEASQESLKNELEQLKKRLEALVPNSGEAASETAKPAEEN